MASGKEAAPNVKFEKFVEDVPIAGTKEIYSAQNVIEKVAWAIILLTGTALTAYYIFKVFDEYRQNKTATTIYYKRNETYKVPPLFICPPIWVDDEKINATGLSHNAILFGLSYLTRYVPENLEELNVDAIKHEFLEYLYRNNFASIHDFYYSIALESETFIDTCDNCITKQNLTKVRFCNTICYKLYAEDVDTRMQTAADPITIKLLPQNQSELTYLPEVRKSYAFIFDNDEKFPIPFKEIFLERNTKTDIYITPKINIFLNTKEEPCDETWDSDYSQKMCHSSCIQKNLFQACTGCYMLGFFEGPSTDTKEYPLCNGFTSPAEEKCFKKDLSEAAKKCDGECTLFCRQVMNDISLFTSKQYVGTLATTIDGDVTVIEVNYQVASFGLQHFEEISTYSFESMVSNVGGQLGLWIGASIMTLVQLIMFSLRTCWSETYCRFWRVDKAKFINEKF